MRGLGAVIRVINLVLVRELLRRLPGWLDHGTDADVMHERINAGSDKYFSWRRWEDHRRDGWQVEDPATDLRIRLGRKKLKLPPPPPAQD